MSAKSSAKMKVALEKNVSNPETIFVFMQVRRDSDEKESGNNHFHFGEMKESCEEKRRDRAFIFPEPAALPLRSNCQLYPPLHRGLSSPGQRLRQKLYCPIRC